MSSRCASTLSARQLSSVRHRLPGGVDKLRPAVTGGPTLHPTISHNSAELQAQNAKLNAELVECRGSEAASKMRERELYRDLATQKRQFELQLKESARLLSSAQRKRVDTAAREAQTDVESQMCMLERLGRAGTARRRDARLSLPATCIPDRELEAAAQRQLRELQVRQAEKVLIVSTHMCGQQLGRNVTCITRQGG